jgi:hypothetical protein
VVKWRHALAAADKTFDGKMPSAIWSPCRWRKYLGKNAALHVLHAAIDR